LLTDAIGSYLDSLTEREFDAPFMALLRLQGFTDIHLLHGAFEFGKDFIGKRVEKGQQYQYVFQTKAGDINLSEWGGCRAQIDMLRTNSAAHCNFDKFAPRRARFVITGRLVGGAPIAAQEYREHLKILGEAEFETWDRDTLVEQLSVDPICLSGSPLELLHILGSRHEQLNFVTLEHYSRGWIRSAWSGLNLRDSLEAAVIASHCRRQNRVDLACHVFLMLLRSTLATVHGQEPAPDTAATAIRMAKAQFRYYARQLWADCRDHYLDHDEMILADPTPFGFATYPARCLTVIEFLGMLGLLEVEFNEDVELPREIATYLGRFIEANVGATHPLSDRWNVSLVPPALLFERFAMGNKARALLQACTKWVADHYDDDGFGLAGPHATPWDEVLYLLGTPFQDLPLRRRPESYIASTILDLASVLEQAEMYDLARNEFLAVDLVLPVVETDDDQGQYSLHAGDHRLEPNMCYQDYWEPANSWKHAPHHWREAENRYPQRIDGHWDQLAISCVLRDRHFVKSWRGLIGRSAH
jgi:hypothetical protein